MYGMLIIVHFFLTVIKVFRHDGIGIEDRYKVSDFSEEKGNIDESV
jgi:hypothetical protein